MVFSFFCNICNFFSEYKFTVNLLWVTAFNFCHDNSVHLPKMSNATSSWPSIKFLIRCFEWFMLWVVGLANLMTSKHHNEKLLFSFAQLPMLTHFWPIFPFSTSWKHQKSVDFLVFSGGIKREHWLKMGWNTWHALLSCFGYMHFRSMWSPDFFHICRTFVQPVIQIGLTMLNHACESGPTKHIKHPLPPKQFCY